MTGPALQQFDLHCRTTLHSFLRTFGYTWIASHCRPLGISVEFSMPNNLFFAVCEGNVACFDLVVCDVETLHWRISLNQALWYRGVRAVSERRSCSGFIELFVREAATHCEDLLRGNVFELDRRYAFPMSETELRLYLKSQRGEPSQHSS